MFEMSRVSALEAAAGRTGFGGRASRIYCKLLYLVKNIDSIRTRTCDFLLQSEVIITK